MSTLLPSTVLYRVYDRNGVLLYVGVTNDVPTRFGQHGRDKPWWRRRVDPARTQLTEYPTRSAAEFAEAEAIRTEFPLFNVMHSRPAPEGEWCPYVRLGGFLPGVFVRDDDGPRIVGRVLFDVYLAWAEEEGLPPSDVLTRQALFRALEARGARKRRDKRGMTFEGLRRVLPLFGDDEEVIA